MKKFESSSFKLNPIAASVVLAMVTQLMSSVAYGNAGYGVNTDISGKTFAVPTYYANSPQGLQPALDPVTHLPTIDPTTKQPWASAAAAFAARAPMVDTGKPLRKFVDPLRGVDGAGIPLAIPEKWFNPLTQMQTQDDYYEIGIVQYTQQMHSDLPKATTLRGYVQIETDGIAQGKCNNPKVVTPGLCDAAGVQSEHIAATYPDGTFIKDAQGNQVFWVHKPSYLGPIIVASRGTAVRLKYTNYLPYNDRNGFPVGATNGGEMPIPVDEHIAGGGPVVDGNGNPIRDQNGNPIKFAQNRAEIHWHGGDSPWISDGTPHQWVAPAADVSYIIKDPTHPDGVGKGDSFRNVPDMPDPGPGSGTLYFPNNLSARLMFYHDHTSGLTRLNVYLGEAAGYVVTDPVEQNLVKTGIIPNTLLGVGIPLVIQDKTFVPKNVGPLATQSEDAKWDVNHWGQPGDLWFPHVYETNQDPNSVDGTNPVGRWDWGPWFWPVFPAQYSLPTGAYGDATTTPEAFMDTMVVNGQAYPTLTVDPVPTRFRILSVGNDRSLNLSLYQAVDANGKICDVATNPAPAIAAPAPGQTAALAACTELRMVPAATSSNLPPDWPTDGRAGGVPDPTTRGPDFIQIGNEAGLLPAPVVIHPQPVTYDQNKRSVTIFNVLNHGLLLGGAERADVIVDFTKYAGKTLILYNDSPAPMPGLDPRIDYFTGQGDQTDAGGSYNTLPGYGPNTRTVMQIKVNPVAAGAVPAAAFNMTALSAALPAAYKASQPAPIVPESAYNAAFGTNSTDNYARIFTGSNTQPDFMYTAPGYGVLYAMMTTVGAGYKSVPQVVINGQLPVGGVPAKAKAIMEDADIAPGRISRIEFTDVGQGYLTPPTITLVGGSPTIPATATIVNFPKPVVNSAHVINKAIQELFDPLYGRMNATLAVELPFSSALTQTTIPLAYIDAPIDHMDGIKDGETQIWKITHNGVDSHPVHFHLVNVQVINRVDWAGVVKPPMPNELGWKETLLMSPLEDVYVAVQAKHPVAPFGLPKSARVLDPSQAAGSQLGFTQIDQMTGQTPTFQTQLVNGVSINVPTNRYSNQLTDFDNEYVWHCHILGHEENDFMRPFIFHPDVMVPDAPGKITVTGTTVSWSDPTPVNAFDANGVWNIGLDAQGMPTAGLDATGNPVSSPKNEIGFYVQKKGLNGLFATVATVPANVTSWNDPAQVAGDIYQVIAYNVAGQSAPGTATTPIVGSSIVASTSTGAILAAAQQTLTTTTTATAVATATAPASTTTPPPAAPTGLTQTLNTNGSVTVSWNAVAGATVYLVTVNGVQQVVTGTSLTLAAASNSNISVVAVGPGGTSLASAGLYNGAAFGPVAFSATNPGAVPGSVTLTWANSPSNVNNVTGLTLSWTKVGTTTPTTKLFLPNSKGVTITGLTSGASYTFTIMANGTAGNSLITPATTSTVVVQ